MLSLHFSPPQDRPLQLLCLGAHPDDLEIGAGGTVQHLVRSYPRLHCRWIVLTGAGRRGDEARASAAAFLAGAASADVTVEHFPDGFLPGAWGEVKRRFEQWRSESEPDLILTHHRHDRHQDHRTVAELTWNTWRDHLILEYEIPKYEGDLHTPNLYVPLPDEAVTRKIELLLEHFPSQHGKHWFDPGTFRGLMRLRGLECAAPSGYAEAFHAPKAVLA